MNAETMHQLNHDRARERMREAREARLARQLRTPANRRRPRLTVVLIGHALALHREAAAR